MEFEHTTPMALRERAGNYFFTRIGDVLAEVGGDYDVIVIDCPPLAQPVYIDRDMWEEIVLNLVSNAFKFTTEVSVFPDTLPFKWEDAAAKYASTAPK